MVLIWYGASSPQCLCSSMYVVLLSPMAYTCCCHAKNVWWPVPGWDSWPPFHQVVRIMVAVVQFWFSFPHLGRPKHEPAPKSSLEPKPWPDLRSSLTQVWFGFKPGSSCANGTVCQLCHKVLMLTRGGAPLSLTLIASDCCGKGEVLSLIQVSRYRLFMWQLSVGVSHGRPEKFPRVSWETSPRLKPM